MVFCVAVWLCLNKLFRSFFLNFLTVKSKLNAVFACAVLGIVGTFVAAILAFPILPLYLYATSAGLGLLAGENILLYIECVVTPTM